MSKNFEDAYRAEVQQNIPDLWHRIESGLPEKTIVADDSHSAVTEAESITEFAATQKAAETEASYAVNTEQRKLNHKSDKKKNPYAWIKWASLAAAGLFVVLLLPAVLGLGLLGLASGKSESMDMAATESNAAESPHYSADYEMADGAAEEEVQLQAPAMENGATSDEKYTEETVEIETTVESVPMESDKDTQEVGMAESESGSVSPVEVYGDVVIEDVTVMVGGISIKSGRDYYRVGLYFEGENKKLADELFADADCYNDGRLDVRVYYDITLEPEVAEQYTVTIYVSAVEATGVEDEYLQYTAELKEKQ